MFGAIRQHWILDNNDLGCASATINQPWPQRRKPHEGTVGPFPWRSTRSARARGMA
jgi:hypothetical protein